MRFFELADFTKVLFEYLVSNKNFLTLRISFGLINIFQKLQAIFSSRTFLLFFSISCHFFMYAVFYYGILIGLFRGWHYFLGEKKIGNKRVKVQSGVFILPGTDSVKNFNIYTWRPPLFTSLAGVSKHFTLSVINNPSRIFHRPFNV